MDQVHKLNAEIIATLYDITSHYDAVSSDSQNLSGDDPILYHFIHIVDDNNYN